MQISAGDALPVTLYGVLIGYRSRGAAAALGYFVSFVPVAPSPLRQILSTKHNLDFLSETRLHHTDSAQSINHECSFC